MYKRVAHTWINLPRGHAAAALLAVCGIINGWCLFLLTCCYYYYCYYYYFTYVGAVNHHLLYGCIMDLVYGGKFI